MRLCGFGNLAASGVLLAALVLFLPHSAFAQTSVPPTDPVARAAYDVLSKHCARCHQAGRLVDREKPARNFGNILKLDEIAASPHYVLPGNPLGSKLFRQIADREMPYDVNYEGETRYSQVSADDLEALERWIGSLGTRAATACANRTAVTPAAAADLIAADLEKLPPPRRAATRYLTLTHLANVCADPGAMKAYRQGAIKLVNSLARTPNVVRLETIDPDASILRINLADVGWNAADWEMVLAAYPYNAQAAGPSSAAITAATQTPIAAVRADWFAYAASRPPLYEDLMRLPTSVSELAREQGVNIEANIRNFVAQRAGFQHSGISQNNRLVERHGSRNGYFWTSYDFAGNRGNQNIFAFPLGPAPNGFQHDGGETIFSLPNGFQGYFLSSATGSRIEKGMTTIVRDPSRKDFAVTNGVSCMGCHDQGLRKVRDEVRDVVLSSRALPRDIRDKVEALHPPQARMNGLLEGDMKRFAEAMARAGLDPSLKLAGVEPINALAKRYEDDVDLALAAAELGVDKSKVRSSTADQKFYALLRRLEQGAVPRDQFELAWRELAASVTDQRIVVIARARAREELPQAFRSAELSLTSDADYYRPGDGPIFTIASTRDCYLTLTNVDEKGEGTVLLPNRFQQDNLIRAGQPIQFPAANAPFQYRTKDKGIENIVAVCTVRPDDNDGIKHNFTREAFTSVKNYTRALGRALEVVPAGAAVAGSTAPPPPSTATSAVPPAPALNVAGSDGRSRPRSPIGTAPPTTPAPAGSAAPAAETAHDSATLSPPRSTTRESFRAAIQVTVR